MRCKSHFDAVVDIEPGQRKSKLVFTIKHICIDSGTSYHSGWWSIFSANKAVLDMKDQAWLKSEKKKVLDIAFRSSTYFDEVSKHESMQIDFSNIQIKVYSHFPTERVNLRTVC